MVSLGGSFLEFLIPSEGGVAFGWGEATGFNSLLFFLFGDAVEFALPFWKKLFEECVTDSSGVKGVVGVVILSCFVSSEEEHQFGEFEGGCLLCKRCGKKSDSVNNTFVGVGGRAV